MSCPHPGAPAVHLEALRRELAGRGWITRLLEPPGRPSSLFVQNPDPEAAAPGGPKSDQGNSVATKGRGRTGPARGKEPTYVHHSVAVPPQAQEHVTSEGSKASSFAKKRTKAGIDATMLDSAKGDMTPGTSALVLLSADAAIDTVAQAFEGHAMELMRSDLSVQQEDRLRAAFAGSAPRTPATKQSGELVINRLVTPQRHHSVDHVRERPEPAAHP